MAGRPADVSGASQMDEPSSKKPRTEVKAPILKDFVPSEAKKDFPVGSWTCPGCQNVNFPGRMSCNARRCGLARPAHTIPQAADINSSGGMPVAPRPSGLPGNAPPGSWVCTSCTNVNFPGRNRCNARRCGLPRTPDADFGYPAAGTGMPPQDGLYGMEGMGSSGMGQGGGLPGMPAGGNGGYGGGGGGGYGGYRPELVGVGGVYNSMPSAYESAQQEPYNVAPAADPYGRPAAADPYGRPAAANPYARPAAADLYGRSAAADPYGRPTDPYGNMGGDVYSQPMYGGMAGMPSQSNGMMGGGGGGGSMMGGGGGGMMGGSRGGMMGSRGGRDKDDGSWREGSWTCSCGNINWPHRETCNRKGCTLPKPDGLPDMISRPNPPQRQEQNAPEGAWTCTACQNVNWPHRTACNKRGCGKARE